ncbi:MAG: hypothetical protein KF866_09695 [Phycisphaeraceae bacterium]|nr:hypothetical protein [Phycisphaeraceae bacterium]MCW5754772.1 hypothetical protein [Phycisphaeraceae bacterium]
MTAAHAQPEPVGFDAIAGGLALVLPGAGHFYRGDRRRGVFIAIGILGLFFGGLLIGGVSVVDRRSERHETRLSFIGQAFVGPTVFVVDAIHQSRFKGVAEGEARPRHPLPGETIRGGRIQPAMQGESPPMRPSLGKVNEIGVLYCLLAGMLNFIAFLDALFPSMRAAAAAAPKGTGAIDAVLRTGSGGGTA